MEFGWLPEKKEYTTQACVVRPLPNYNNAIDLVSNSAQIINKWFYPPMQVNAEGNAIPVQTPWFSLPTTHSLSYTGPKSGNNLESFLIHILSWVKGLPLRQAHGGHFYKVATSVAQLSDFSISDTNVCRVLELAIIFYIKYTLDINKIFSGALHWFMFSQSYTHHFERFMMQYMTFDALWKVNSTISGARSKTHAERFEIISDLLGVQLPLWAVSNGKQSIISDIRNKLIHEAQFYDEPIGYSVPSDSNIVLDLEAFNSRLIAATIGAFGNYSRSSSTTRQIFMFEID